MVREKGIEALVSGFVMATPAYLDRVLRTENVNIPVIHACQTPGTYCGRIALLGSTTIQAIRTLIETWVAAVRAGDLDAVLATAHLRLFGPSRRSDQARADDGDLTRRFYLMLRFGGSTLICSTSTGLLCSRQTTARTFRGAASQMARAESPLQPMATWKADA